MASTQSLPVAEGPRRKIIITVTASLLECAELRDLDPSSYLLELFRADLAEVRLAKLQQSRHRNFVDKKPPPRTSNTYKCHKPQKMDEAEVQRVLFLRESERLSIDALAERFGRSATRIGTILRNYEEAAHVALPAPTVHNRPPNTTFGNFCLDGSVPLPRRTRCLNEKA